MYWYSANSNKEITSFIKLTPDIEQIPLDVVPKILKSNIWKELPRNFDNLRTTYLFNNYGPIFLSLDYFLGTSNIKKTNRNQTD